MLDSKSRELNEHKEVGKNNSFVMDGFRTPDHHLVAPGADSLNNWDVFN